VLGDAAAYADDVPGIAAALNRVLVAPPAAEPGRALARSFTWAASARSHLELYGSHPGLT
jgi:hypothetical protein